ncbi:hypothetical protein HGB47_03735 [Leptospira yasudae]|uniref:hypothetical protein n=1 Tax=Leptospira yasudae TaxID=2202201 RepID=UPI001C4FF61A|nr:hypothetical protein [Leptospira yasudae]MBW0432719.1 hypothetical protein [Leptospira yasudae]
MLLKRMFLIFLFVLCDSLFAVDIENRDKNPYRIQYDDAGTRHNEIINPGKKMSSICGECTVYISSIGSLQAAGSDKIIIKDGTAKVE